MSIINNVNRIVDIIVVLSMSLGEAFKRALFDKIEERYDVVIGEEAYKEYVDNGKKSRPFSELKGELNLWPIP